MIICTPTRGKMTSETRTALLRNMDGFPSLYCCVRGRPVDEARNMLAQMARDAAAQQLHGREAFVLWADDDAWWPRGTVARMVSVLRSRPDISILAGVSSVRLPFAGILGSRGPQDPSFGITSYDTADENGLCKVEALTLHFAMHRLTVFEKLGKQPFEVQNVYYAADDQNAFCFRARHAGLSMYLDFRSPVAHIEASTGFAFVPGGPPARIQNNQLFWAREFNGKRPALVQKQFQEKITLRSYGPAIDGNIHLILQGRRQNVKPHMHAAGSTAKSGRIEESKGAIL